MARRAEDLEIADLATIFEASANAIRIRLHRARQALRERLGSDALLPARTMKSPEPQASRT
jgi:DNA-directed RNA polymerase specialized sigma24 family protein